MLGTSKNIMQTITIPDFGTLTLATIVCDYNGTLAVDGVLLPGVKEAINKITDIDVHVITADTFGVVREQLKGCACHVTIAPGRSGPMETGLYQGP